MTSPAMQGANWLILYQSLIAFCGIVELTELRELMDNLS
jgi:hypothetical protein